jgi:hypothetical protein
MDSAICNVIYVDRNVRENAQLAITSTPEDVDATLGDSAELLRNLSLLINAFREGMSVLSVVSPSSVR